MFFETLNGSCCNGYLKWKGSGMKLDFCTDHHTVTSGNGCSHLGLQWVSSSS